MYDYLVIPAPGYYGDTLAVCAVCRTLRAARSACGAGRRIIHSPGTNYSRGDTISRVAVEDMIRVGAWKVVT